MSLAQYLALGKSIKNVSGPGRYRLPGQPMVPNFSGSRTVIEAEPEPELEAKGEPERVFPAPPEPEVTAEASAPATPAPERPAEAIPTAIPAKPAQSASGTRWFLGGPPVRRRMARRAMPPEQRELELGMVAPVRNDLAESDIEVVPVSAPEAAPEAGWWGRMWRRAGSWWPGRAGRGMPG